MKPITSIGIVYNNSNPYTTGNFILKGFQELGYNATHLVPGYYTNESYSHFLFVDSGHECEFYTPIEKTFIYAIDSYQLGLGLGYRESWWHKIGHKASHIFDAFEYGYEWWKERGFPVSFFSMGVDEKMYYKDPQPVIADVCFVGGRKNEGKRKQILDHVRERYVLHDPATSRDGLRIAGNSCKCFLDISPMEEDMAGQRFFEGIALQTPFVTASRKSIQSYNWDGMFYYNQSDNAKVLVESLWGAIDAAIAYNKPIRRDISKITWTNKIKTQMIPILEA